MDEADDENMKELLKSYGAVETNNRDESDAVVAGMYSNISCYFIQVYTSAWASLVAQTVKHLPAMLETWV